jgi:GTPase SAR1 family protein
MEDKREVSLDRVEKFKREKNIQFHFETSAMTGENIEDLFIMASKILYNNFKDKIAQLVSNPDVNPNFEMVIERRSDKKEADQKAEEASLADEPIVDEKVG